MINSTTTAAAIRKPQPSGDDDEGGARQHWLPHLPWNKATTNHRRRHSDNTTASTHDESTDTPSSPSKTRKEEETSKNSHHRLVKAIHHIFLLNMVARLVKGKQRDEEPADSQNDKKNIILRSSSSIVAMAVLQPPPSPDTFWDRVGQNLSLEMVFWFLGSQLDWISHAVLAIWVLLPGHVVMEALAQPSAPQHQYILHPWRRFRAYLQRLYDAIADMFYVPPRLRDPFSKWRKYVMNNMDGLIDYGADAGFLSKMVLNIGGNLGVVGAHVGLHTGKRTYAAYMTPRPHKKRRRAKADRM